VAAIDAPVLAPLPDDQDEASIAFGNGIYLGVWRDSVPGASGLNFVAAARFDTTGNPLDADPVEIYEHGDGLDQPGVVFDGSRFLIYWTDPVNNQDILGRYLDAAGTLGEVFTIGADASSQTQQYEAGAAAGNGLVLVAWTDYRTVPLVPLQTHIRFSLVNGDNSFVVQDVPLSTNSMTGFNARSATVTYGGPNAHNFLIAWQEGNNGIQQVMAAIVDETGAVTPVVASPPNPTPFPPSLSSTDSNLELYQSRGPTSATDGQLYFVAWEDTREPSFNRSAIWGRTVQFNGQANSSDAQLAIGPAPSPNSTSQYIEPQACFADGNFLVVWEWWQKNGAVDDYRLYADRVAASPTPSPSPSPSPLDGNGVEVTATQRSQLASQSRRSTLATDGNKTLLAFTQTNNPISGSDVFLLPIDPSQPLGDNAPILLGRGHNAELGRVIASNGSVMLLLWEDTRNVSTTGMDIYGMRFDRLGQPLDAQPFVICNAPGNQFLANATAAPEGNFLVVWSDNRVAGGDVSIYGTRVGTSGAPLDGNGFKIRPGIAVHARLAPTVAANANGWLVAWEDWRNLFAGSVPYPEVWATTVTSGGTVATSEFQITSALSQAAVACAPAAIWNGQRFFVAYEQPCTQTPQGLQGAIKGTWIDPTPHVNPVPVSIAASAMDSDSAPSLTLDGSGHIVVTWVGGGKSINAALIADNDTKVTNATQIITNAGNRDVPSVGFAAAPGTNGTMLFTWIDDNPQGVQAQRTDGLFNLIGGPFPLTTSATFKGFPPQPLGTFTGFELAGAPRISSAAPIAVTSGGSALVSANTMVQIGDAGRTYARLAVSAFGLQPRGAPCTDAGDCVDSVCTRGVCCDTPCDGVCQACGASGCIVTPPTDTRCGGAGGISCGGLTTMCRTYHDLPVNGCYAFGQCAEAGNLSECTSFDDAPDNTPCSSSACASGGTCMGGVCACGGTPFPDGGRHLVTNAPTSCSINGRGDPSPWAALILLALLALRRKRAAT
jgi:hypothetical protein